LQAARFETSPLIAGLGAARKLLRMVKHKLIKTPAHFFSRSVGALGDLIIYRKRELHTASLLARTTHKKLTRIKVSAGTPM
jgi:hypothetical protein